MNGSGKPFWRKEKIWMAVLGVAAVPFLLFREGGQLYCGGTVSLLVAAVVLCVIAIMRRKITS